MKIYIGTPMYGGAAAEYVSSLLETYVVLHCSGHTVEVDLHTGCSILPKARNEITRRFFSSGFDKLLFLDSDMGWDALDIVKLIDSEHQVCGIDYRKKNDVFKTVATKTGRVRDGWEQAVAAGTGILCIARTVIEELISAYPETKYADDDGSEIFALFDFGIHDGKYHGEDYLFCKRWVALGGEISLLAGAKTSHIGIKKYQV